MLFNGNRMLYVGLVALSAFSLGAAQETFKYSGCDDITINNFTKVILVNKSKDAALDEPIRFAVANNGDVFYAERNGLIKVAKANGSIVKVGTVPVYPPTSGLKKKVAGNINNELGLTGLTLDPNFATNRWIYVDYEPNSPDVMNISRFTLNGDVLDLGSEKILLSLPMQKNYCCHTGGDMAFDNQGNLFVSTGDNTNVNGTYVDESDPDGDDQGHSANTNDLRGKILRIHPTADGAYTIPAGNLKEAFASKWTTADQAKVKPEIYTMGHRNPYTISVDTLQNLLTWGDVGPDDGWDTEELNSVDKPGFMGWPYFAGGEGNPHYLYRMNKSAAAPMNTSPNNTGVQALPPAVGATIGYGQSAAITGPVYRFMHSQTSTKKLPAHFDGKWLVADFKAGWLHVISLDGTGTKSNASNSLIGDLRGPLQVKIGPDGLLYVLEYGGFYHFGSNGGTEQGAGSDGNTRISRYEYTGKACATAVSIHDQADAHAKRSSKNTGLLFNLGFSGQRTVSLPQGAKGLRVYDLAGNQVWKFQGDRSGANRLALPTSLGNGIYRLVFDF